MVPRTGVVTGPGCRVTLPACVRGPREHKWPQIRIEFEQALIRGARILHAVDIVNFQVVCGTWPESRLIDAMLYVVRHRQIWSMKNGGLIHVVPKARDPFCHKILIQSAPPLPARLLCELRKNRRPWPDCPDIRRAVRVLHKMVTSHTGVVWGVTRSEERR